MEATALSGEVPPTRQQSHPPVKLADLFAPPRESVPPRVPHRIHSTGSPMKPRSESVATRMVLLFPRRKTPTRAAFDPGCFAYDEGIIT
jgi:hypothetical protein